VLLWTACAWLVWRIVYGLTRSFTPALLAAAIVLVDPRAIVTIIVLEHASSLACVFGLIAITLVIDAGDRRLSGAKAIALCLLLLASALSKEYGLAFTGAVTLWSLRERRTDMAAPAAIAGAAYLAMRFVFASGPVPPHAYCQQSGYFLSTRTVCFDAIHADVITQAAYNVAATAVGSVLPWLFTPNGQIDPQPVWLIDSVAWLAVVAFGCWRTPRFRSLILLVVACNAILSFALYRDRDHVVAVCVLGIAAGIGVAGGPVGAMNAAETSALPRLLRRTFVAALLVLLAARAITTRMFVASEVASAQSFDPCDALGGPWPLDKAFATRIKTEYRMPNPDCTPAR